MADEAALDQYRQALTNIGRRLQHKGPSEDALRELLPFVVKARLERVIIPEMTFRPPATLVDAIDFFKQASRDYDDPKIPVEKRGISFILKLKIKAEGAEVGGADDPFAVTSDSSYSSNIPVIPALSARYISLYDALKLVCDVTGYKLRLSGGLVMIVPLDDPDH